MLDSIFTLRPVAAAWIGGAIVLCVVIDRLLSFVLGMPVSLFGLFALMLLAYLGLAALYSAGKWVFGLFVGREE